MDTQGADDEVTVTLVQPTTAGTSEVPIPESGEQPVVGLYGTLYIEADGDYRYVRSGVEIPDGETDVFLYTIEDIDGSTSSANLTISFPPGIGDPEPGFVDEDDLPVIGNNDEVIPRFRCAIETKNFNRC